MFAKQLSLFFVVILFPFPTLTQASESINSSLAPIFFRELMKESNRRTLTHEFPHSRDSSCELSIHGIIGDQFVSCFVLDPFFTGDANNRIEFCGLPHDLASEIGKVESSGGIYKTSLTNEQFFKLYERIEGNPLDHLMCFH
jgi:hypothetical protein